MIDQRGGVQRQHGNTVLQQSKSGKDLGSGLHGGRHQDEIHMRLQGGTWICGVSGEALGEAAMPRQQ